MTLQMLNKILAVGVTPLLALLVLLSGCSLGIGSPTARLVPHERDWGIYEQDLATLTTRLVYSSQDEIQTSALRVNGAGDRLVFAQKVGGTLDSNFEIFSVATDGTDLRRLTDNDFWDIYPVWSPDGQQIAFLSKREKDFDIYVMDTAGNASRLYDSGYHDADIDWSGDSIVFTSQFAIWRMDSDGTGARRITNPAGRGEWGAANLPRGDYDPRLSRNGDRIVFERLVDVTVPNGGYDLFVVGLDGSGEIRLSNNGYSQGLASWANSGDKIAYTVAAMEGKGLYHIFTMRPDGSDKRDVTPSYFPPNLLCYAPVFSHDDSSVYFIGHWWK